LVVTVESDTGQFGRGTTARQEALGARGAEVFGARGAEVFGARGAEVFTREGGRAPGTAADADEGAKSGRQA
jgi:hypothetical protein